MFVPDVNLAFLETVENTGNGEDPLMKGRTKKKPSQKAPSSSGEKERSRMIREYEKGLKLFFKKNFQDARDQFQVVKKESPEGSPISLRAGLFAKTCESRIAQASFSPKKVDDLYFLAVIQTNNGHTEEAISLLNKAQGQTPKDDRLAYLQAVNHFRMGSREQAMGFLQESIGLKEINRTLAKNDPEFEEIREDDDFLATVAWEK